MSQGTVDNILQIWIKNHSLHTKKFEHDWKNQGSSADETGVNINVNFIGVGLFNQKI